MILIAGQLVGQLSNCGAIPTRIGARISIENQPLMTDSSTDSINDSTNIA